METHEEARVLRIYISNTDKFRHTLNYLKREQKHKKLILNKT